MSERSELTIEHSRLRACRPDAKRGQAMSERSELTIEHSRLRACRPDAKRGQA